MCRKRGKQKYFVYLFFIVEDKNGKPKLKYKKSLTKALIKYKIKKVK